MEKMNKTFVALVGLTADPITNGHQGLAEAAGMTGYFNEVWFLPCYGHKFGKTPAPAIHRLTMCEIVARSLGDRYKASPFEMNLKSDGNAYETIQSLRQEYPDHKFIWIIGSDNALKIDKWANSEQLRKEVPFWVVPRKGIPIPPDVTWFNEGHHHLLNTNWEDGVSATEVRRMLLSGDPEAAKHVHPDVYMYIQNMMDGFYTKGDKHEGQDEAGAARSNP